MNEWVIPLLSAIGGAAVALTGKEIIEWYKRPRIEINFEKREGQSPYLIDLHNETSAYAGQTFRIKYLRLKVHNKGKKPAMNCEAKLRLAVESETNTINKVALHWSRRDPTISLKSDLYAPINLNREDWETVDVLKLPYSFSTLPDTNHSPNPHPCIESASLRQLVLQPNATYHGKVTVYASNASPKSFKFKVNWDGTVEGFNNAFTKD